MIFAALSRCGGTRGALSLKCMAAGSKEAKPKLQATSAYLLPLAAK
jgi:hypothetical protein